MFATLTIGQAPRTDITPILTGHLPEGLPVLHAGLLDGLSRVEIDRRFAPAPGQPELITRLLDGSSVRLGKAAAKEALQEKLLELEEAGARQVLLLCTGYFEGLALNRGWLIEPDRILPPAVSAMMGDRQLGVVVPLSSQAVSESGKFAGLSRKPFFAVASPYSSTDDDLERAGLFLKEQGAAALLLDCMGFTERHREVACRAAGLPVILSNALIAKLCSELVCRYPG